MPAAKLDEDLVEGLSKAKKAPRNFALITKGAAPVKLLVKKKKIKDAELQKAKSESKGTDYIVGVIEGNGSEFVFKVTGDKEPTILAMKIKELIGEQADMTVKARWELVKELPDIGEEEGQPKSSEESTPTAPPPPSDPQATTPPPPPPPPSPPPPPPLDGKQLLATLNKLSPQIQAAALANPDRKAELLQPVMACQQQIKNNELEQAKASLEQVVALLKSLPAPTPQPSASSKDGPLVAFQKSRLDWDTTRKAVQSELQTLEKTILEMSSGEEDFDQIAAGTKNLYTMLETLDTRLIDKLDEALNAEQVEQRKQKQIEALDIVDEYLDFVEDDDLIGDIDDNGFIGVNIRGRLVATLNDLAKRLAV